MSAGKPKVKLVQDVPPPPPITPEVRARLVEEAKLWRAEFAERIAAVEAITSDDLKIRVR
jgi:hypothetical protein